MWMWKWDLPSFKARSGRGGGDILVKKVRAHEFGLNRAYLLACVVWILVVYDGNLFALKKIAWFEALNFRGLTEWILGRRCRFHFWGNFSR